MEVTNTFFTLPESPATASTKNTRSALADSRNTPGAMRDNSSRLSSWRRYSSLCLLAQGARNSDSSAITSTSGTAKISTGRTQAVSGRPALNQITISESR